MTPRVIGGSGFGGSPRTIPKNPKNPKIPPGPPVLGDRRRYIHFLGQAYGYINSGFTRSFDVLAGDQPPQITGGYGVWDEVQLPLQETLLIYTGQSAVKMQISVRFSLHDANGTWLVGDDAGRNLEYSIEMLEWMAGTEGEHPPFVFPSTYDAAGNSTALIPFKYQASNPSFLSWFGSIPWVITDLSWDANPIRNDSGLRIRQDASVTVGAYARLPSDRSGAVPRPKATTFVSRDGADTAMLIARSVAAENPPKLAAAIVQAAQNKKLQLRSVNQVIKHGRRVYVPSSVTTFHSPA